MSDDVGRRDESERLLFYVQMSRIQIRIRGETRS